MDTPSPLAPDIRRIVVIGATGSGKTTMAAALAGRLGAQHIEIDALHWGPNWTHCSDEALLQRLDAATRSDGWVMDGNYGITRPVTWPRAQAVVWLDYPFWTIFRQLFFRTLRRAWTREVLWNNNVEPFWIHFKLWSKDSLFAWLFMTYRRRKRQYPALFARPEYAHLKVYRFKKPRQANDWLASI
ncbi:MAG: AAA family ATPase [Anaerolineales bacterium]|nr:AAA family ATPase [Anaerolineales bacterium]